jgi:hypothetical protein
MADITMCAGEGCLKKESCYRFNATPNPFRQSYFMDIPLIQVSENVHKCEEYSRSDTYRK